VFFHDQLKEDEMGGHVTGIYDIRNILILIGKHKRKRPLGILRHRLAGNIAWTSKFGYKSVDWTDLTRDRDERRVHVNTVLNLLVP
jgi:hypothetical protein